MADQRLCFLAAQPHALLVGKDKKFSEEGDFFKWAAEHAGFDGVALHINGHVKADEILKSESFGDDLQNRFIGYGFKHGVIRLEMHGDGQCVCVDSSRVKRVAGLIGLNGRNTNVGDVETTAHERMLKNIDAAAKLGFKDMPGFCGGRGYAKLQAKWTAYPELVPEWVFALLAHKWNTILERGADRDVTVTFEIGHPENDLLTGENFERFLKYLTPKARKGVGVNIDISHFLMQEDNPIPHIKRVIAAGKKYGVVIRFTMHNKGAVKRDSMNGTTSSYGGFLGWASCSHTFATAGIVGQEEIWRDFHKILQGINETQDGGVDLVNEGECVFTDTQDSMIIGAENGRAFINGTDLVRMDNVVSNEPRIQTTPFLPKDKPCLSRGNKPYDGIKLSEGEILPFDAFAGIDVPAPCIMDMTVPEVQGCLEIFERSGEEEAAKAAHAELKIMKDALGQAA